MLELVLVSLKSEAILLQVSFLICNLEKLTNVVPKDRRYTKSHEWIKLENNVGVVGITDHAQAALGDVVFVELPGTQIKSSRETTFSPVFRKWKKIGSR